MKKYYYLLIALIFITPLKIFSADDIKIAYVNVEVLLKDLVQSDEIQEAFTKEFTPKQKELIQSADLLREQRESFEINKATMIEAKAQQKEAELKKLEVEFKSKVEKFNEVIKVRERELVAKLQESIFDAIKKIASEKKYDLVLSQQVVFVSEKINITSLVSEYLKKVE